MQIDMCRKPICEYSCHEIYSDQQKEQGKIPAFFVLRSGWQELVVFTNPIQHKLRGPRKIAKQFFGEKEKVCWKIKQRFALVINKQTFDEFKRPQVRFLFVGSAHKNHHCTPTNKKSRVKTLLFCFTVGVT